FSGSHQDAINKGMSYQRAKEDAFWEVPYLPIDPEDVGRSYESIIRINSQSGKGGVAYILEDSYGYTLPKAMHPEFGKIVQHITDVVGRELSTKEIFEEFEKTYFNLNNHIELISFATSRNESSADIIEGKLSYKYGEKVYEAIGDGNGPIDACKHALMKKYPNEFSIHSYFQHSLGEKSSANAAAYIEVERNDGMRYFGVGIDTNTTMASIKALFSAINRAYD
ncbi:MAG: alpha-isopropylmalate synthase regulatory domain-containing protein, partial [Campylobacterota bacterium]|nr:alpha-isopropylmalate synthase regulatory domain-containing protein [Campylobacterota bacterium]